jgi:hypothetical protein
LFSNYHFDNFKNDLQVDKVTKLGKIVADYSEDVKHAIESSKPATWRTRGAVGKTRPEEELAAEDYDLEQFGYGKDYQLQFIVHFPDVIVCNGEEDKTAWIVV